MEWPDLRPAKLIFDLSRFARRKGSSADLNFGHDCFGHDNFGMSARRHFWAWGAHDTPERILFEEGSCTND